MPRLQVNDAQFSFFDGRTVQLPNIDESFDKILLIKGAIGSGKTLLLKAIAGVITPNSGVVEVNAEPYFLHSQSEFNFVTSAVGTELDFIGVNREPFAEYVDRDVSEFSGGQLKRLSVMIALEAASGVLLLDEPLDMLDDVESERMADYIVNASNRTPMIIATHSDSFDEYADNIIVIGRQTTPSLRATPPRRGTEELLLVADKLFVHNTAEISLNLHRGEIVCLYGGNGSGKSLFVRTVAGIGRLEYRGGYEWHVDRAKRGICLQFPEHLIYQGTVAEEIADTAGSANVDRVLSILDWHDRRNSSPFALSDGEKRKMYIISMLTKSEACIFDEPFAGLDSATANFIIDNFIEARDSGKAILYTANRRQDSLYADTTIVIADSIRNPE
ncbi:MAG: ATP-binding cassette domain-containing protein [Deferribacteraceae bacterium]|jgi:energy-coupling factor transporter ATP-binding protein EcfA2|nr:ATP-binding cassette domain-containing protein [Deferribacteraceae bacterium]